MSKISIAAHAAFGGVRTAGTRENPLFCLADICKAVSLSNPSSVRQRLDPDDVQLIDLHAVNPNCTIVGNSEANFVTESGFYEVLLLSSSPKVKPFRRWVTGEVLPSLRKYGKYVVPGSAEEAREERKLEKKIHKEMLEEIRSNLSATDERLIERKLGAKEGTVWRVLAGRLVDTAVLEECINRSSRNARLSEALSSTGVMRQIINILRNGDSLKELVIDK